MNSSPLDSNQTSTTFVGSNQHSDHVNPDHSCTLPNGLPRRMIQYKCELFCLVHLTVVHVSRVSHTGSTLSHRTVVFRPRKVAVSGDKVDCSGPNIAPSNPHRAPQHLYHLCTQWGTRCTGRSQLVIQQYSPKHVSVPIMTLQRHRFISFYDTNVLPFLPQHMSNLYTYTCHAVSGQSRSYVVPTYTNTCSPHSHMHPSRPEHVWTAYMLSLTVNLSILGS